jgi:hypothetical protein
MVELLLAAGADATAVDNEGMDAAAWADAEPADDELASLLRNARAAGER